MGYLYPPISPYSQEQLAVTHGQSLYLEQSGNPSGIPVLVLHGGPGAGLSDYYRRFFDPNIFRVIGFDQRGCGRSLPFATLENNTTWDIIEDVESIRQHLAIDKWMLFGGSWGSTLALLLAIKQPHTVTSIILRGVFLARQQDFDWYLEASGGPAQIFPEYYQDFINPVASKPTEESIVDAFYRTFVHGNEISRLHAVKAWCLWEERISVMTSSLHAKDLCGNVNRALSLSILECHYIKHRCFIDENYILNNIATIKHIPMTIVHGRYDMVCKVENAKTLNDHCKSSQLLVVPEAPHSASDHRIAEALCYATVAMAKYLKEQKS